MDGPVWHVPLEAAQGQQSTPGGTSGTKPTTVVEVVRRAGPSLVVVVVEDGAVVVVVVAVVDGPGGRGVGEHAGVVAAR